MLPTEALSYSVETTGGKRTELTRVQLDALYHLIEIWNLPLGILRHVSRLPFAFAADIVSN